MTLSSELIVGIALAYLGMLLLTAHVGDTFPWATRFARRPFVVALSLGVYATSWSYFGSVGMAAREGYRFLTIYLGVTLACAAAPVVWEPVARVLRERQLATLADLLAFRYRSQAVGVLATLFMLAGSLPYQALQLRGLVKAVEVLGGTQAPQLVGLLTCAGLVLFGALYGARNLAPRERHDGFVLAVAVESFVKLVALFAVGGFALFKVLPSTGGSESVSFAMRAEAELAQTATEGPWATLLLLAFSAAFLLPRQWHLAFTEGGSARAFRTIGWALPLYLLLLTVSVPLVLLGGQRLDPQGEPDFYVLTLARESGSPALAALVFLGGLSASTAMILVTAVALASMSLTHLVLPLAGPLGGDLYRRLRWMRRWLIALIVTGGYLVYLLLPTRLGLADLGLMSFVAVAQFLPGLGGVLFWSRATARGVFVGLLVGVVGWSLSLAVPLLVSAGPCHKAPMSCAQSSPPLTRGRWRRHSRSVEIYSPSWWCRWRRDRAPKRWRLRQPAGVRPYPQSASSPPTRPPNLSCACRPCSARPQPRQKSSVRASISASKSKSIVQPNFGDCVIESNRIYRACSVPSSRVRSSMRGSRSIPPCAVLSRRVCTSVTSSTVGPPFPRSRRHVGTCAASSRIFLKACARSIRMARSCSGMRRWRA